MVVTPLCVIQFKLTDRIAAEVAQVTEAKRKVRGKHLQPKGIGLSPLQGGAAPLRSTRSSSLRRQHNDKQAQLSEMKVNKKTNSH